MADDEVAWQQMKLEVKTPAAAAVKPAQQPELTVVQRDDFVKVGNEHFTVSFNHYTGALERYAFRNGDATEEVLARSDIGSINGLQLWRAPTDNDKGFGKMARARPA